MMRKYEYTIVEVTVPEGINEVLNSYGEVGWRAWGLEIQHRRFDTVACVFMMREIQDQTITGETPVVKAAPKPPSQDPKWRMPPDNPNDHDGDDE